MSEPKGTKDGTETPGAPENPDQAHRQRMDELKSQTKRLKYGTRLLKNTGNVAERMLKNMGSS